MARIRTIKPEFWVDDKVVELSPWARLLFIGMWNFADDHGFVDLAPKRIKMQVFPGDTVDVGPLIDELIKWRLVRAYHSPIGPVLHVANWSRHQRVDHPSKPRFAIRELTPFDPDDPPESSRNPREGLARVPDDDPLLKTVPDNSGSSDANPRESSRGFAEDKRPGNRRSTGRGNRMASVTTLARGNPREDSRTLAPEGKGREGSRTLSPLPLSQPTALERLGLTEREREVLISQIRGEANPRSIDAYIRKLIDNGDIHAWVVRVRAAPVVSYAGPTHAYDDPDDRGQCSQCPLPAHHARHQTSAPAETG